jgi:hypothetical protein
MDPSLNTDGTPDAPRIKVRTAALPVVSNSILILLKVVSGIDHRGLTRSRSGRHR